MDLLEFLEVLEHRLGGRVDEVMGSLEQAYDRGRRAERLGVVGGAAKGAPNHRIPFRHGMLLLPQSKTPFIDGFHL